MIDNSEPAYSVSSDAELIALVRAGDSGAYAKLFERHHPSAVAMAHRYAANDSDAKDLAAEGFANVLATIQRGSGPEEFFRAYLFTVIARLAIRANQAARRSALSEKIEDFPGDKPYDDPAIRSFESSTLAKAFSALPERWQAVLWYTEIEGMRPALVAPLLGLSPNSVSALALRAREGLRHSYLQAHVSAVGKSEGCAPFSAQLGALARNGVAVRQERKLREHLDSCPACADAFLELLDIEKRMRGIIFPLITALPFVPPAGIREGFFAFIAESLHGMLKRFKEYRLPDLSLLRVFVCAFSVCAALAVFPSSVPPKNESTVLAKEATPEIVAPAHPREDAKDHPPNIDGVPQNFSQPSEGTTSRPTISPQPQPQPQPQEQQEAAPAISTPSKDKQQQGLTGTPLELDLGAPASILGEVGQAIRFTATITNTAQQPLSLETFSLFTEAFSAPGPAPAFSCDGIISLQAGQSTTCAAIYTLNALDKTLAAVSLSIRQVFQDNSGAMRYGSSASASVAVISPSALETTEAETSGNQVPTVYDCLPCGGGKRVGMIGLGQSLVFSDIHVSNDALATLPVELVYTNGDSADRTAEIVVNGAAPILVSFPPTGGWEHPGTLILNLPLRVGANTVSLGNPNSYAPDIDLIRY